MIVVRFIETITSEIKNFKVPENQQEIFGKNVTEKMIRIINTI